MNVLIKLPDVAKCARTGSLATSAAASVGSNLVMTSTLVKVRCFSQSMIIIKMFNCFIFVNRT